MKKNIFMVVIFLCLVMVWSTATKAAEKEIYVACMYPMSGSLAEKGNDFKAVYELAADIINQKFDNLPGIPYAETQGIPSLGGAKLKVVMHDTQGSPEIGKAEAERIIMGGQAKFIIGAYQSLVTKPVSAVTERHEFPLLSAVSSAPSLTERGFKYFFRVAPRDDHETVMVFDFLDKMKAAGKEVERIAIVYEKSEYGVGMQKNVSDAIKNRKGCKLVADVPYPYEAASVSAEVLRVKAANPHIIFQCSADRDMILFAKTYQELGVKVNANISVSGAFMNPRFPEQLGKDADGYMGTSYFSVDFFEKKPQLRKINEMFKAKRGVNLDGWTLEAFTALFVAADTFQRAKSTDRMEVVKALRKTELKIDTLPGKGVKFDEKGDNMWADTAVIQIVNGEYRAVWPEGVASTPMIWPMWKR